MRYGIFSDVHGNLEALDAVLAALKREGIDASLCVGDLVGYGANPRECIQKIRDSARTIIAGNHDWATAELFGLAYFNPAAADAVLWTRTVVSAAERAFLSSLGLVYADEDMTMVHGTLKSPQSFYYLIDAHAALKTFAVLTTPVCFVGHSHVPGVFMQDAAGGITYEETDTVVIEKDRRYIVNCGSVGQPRDFNPDAAYCVYDTKQKSAVIRRVPYDRRATRKKIIDAGLPRALGDRLLFGR